MNLRFAGKIAPALLAVLLLDCGLAAAQPGPQYRSIVLNAGETRVIDNLSRTSQPDINVISNSRALVVHSEEPGKLVLLGAERGEWKITVTQADGRKVTYDVTVSAIRNAANPLAPGEAPAALSSSGSMAESAAARPLDSGAGPLAAGASAALPGAAAAAGATTSTSTVLAAAGGVAVPPAATASSSSSAAAASIGATPSLTSQTVKPVRYRTDPSIIGSGLAYSTEGVATSGGKHYLPANGIDLRTGTSQVIDFAERLHRVSIADTKVADVQVINPYQLNLIAHKPGFTTLAVWTGQGHYEERQVRVDPTGKQQVMLNTVVAELDLNNLENQGTNISAALANAGVSLVGMPGAVAAPFTQTIQPGGQSVLGGLTGTSTGTTSSAAVMPPGGQLLPLLLSQNLTYGLATQNGGILTQTFFQFLEQHNLGRILAEPKLLANSGEQAKFLSGGEIPIVVAQALNTSVVFKQFGTSVVFVPTVVGVNDIELLVKPEVSQPDYTHGVQLFGFTVPAFVTRRAETMVRLRDDQTLIIAGLILNQKTEQIEKVPYLGDIPYLGGLFRNTSWTSNQTDLMIAVTPQIVRPLPPGAAVFEPSSRGPLSYSEIRTTRLSTPDPGRPRF